MNSSDHFSVENAVSMLEVDLGIAQGFLIGMEKEDDWSFVIKSHAFAEAAISHLLANAFEEPELHSIFANLDTSNNRFGKLAFLEKLNLLDKDARRFIKSFSELRNLLVHNVSQVSFNFSSYICGFDKQQKDSFCKAFSYFALGESFENEDGKHKTEKFVINHPRKAVWYCVMVLCGVIYVSKDMHKMKKMNDVLRKQISEDESRSS